MASNIFTFRSAFFTGLGSVLIALSLGLPGLAQTPPPNPHPLAPAPVPLAAPAEPYAPVMDYSFAFVAAAIVLTLVCMPVRRD